MLSEKINNSALAEHLHGVCTRIVISPKRPGADLVVVTSAFKVREKPIAQVGDGHPVRRLPLTHRAVGYAPVDAGTLPKQRRLSDRRRLFRGSELCRKPACTSRRFPSESTAGNLCGVSEGGTLYRENDEE